MENDHSEPSAQSVFDTNERFALPSVACTGKRPPGGILSVQGLVDLLALPGRVTTAGCAQIHLPTFQRGEVWKSQQICELWDSLLRGIPLPSILLGRVGQSAALDHVLAKTGFQPDAQDYWLLDGQQRAMALQIGMGLRPREQRLWLDLGWDVDKDGAQHGRRFGFFICSQARPWGDNLGLNGRSNNGDVREARRHINAQHALNGRFDCQISLNQTWPVSAKMPMPVAPLLRWALRQCTAEQITLLGIKKIIDRLGRALRIPEGKKRVSEASESTILRLQKALQRLHRATITVVRADELDPDEGSDALMTTFTRLNRNGARLRDDELFYSALKYNMPQCHGLVKAVTAQSPLLGELDVLRGFTVLASQKNKTSPNDGSNHVVAGTALSPELLKTLRGHKELKFDEDIDGYLKQQGLVKQTIETLRWQPGSTHSDPGLPLTLFPRLELHSWLPVLRWLERRGPGVAVSPLEREALLRFVLIDHLFADWHGGHDSKLRDYLDRIDVAVQSGQSLPLPDADGWLKELRVPLAAGGEQAYPLPLSPTDVQTRFARQSNRNGWPAGDDGELWVNGRSRDLLMWAQREAIEDWFGPLSGVIQHLGEIGKPWDWDHIVPSDFFNHYGAVNQQDISAALSTVWQAMPAVNADRAWDIFKSYRNRTGNYRIWPMGFNRKDGDTPPKDKLQLPAQNELEPHIVLAQWMETQIQGGHQQALRYASAIQPTEPWDQAPDKKTHWTRSQMEALLQAVTDREQALYEDMWTFIAPGLPQSWQANRL